MDEIIKKDLYDLNYSEDFNIENLEEINVDLDLEDTVQNSSTITGKATDTEGNPVSNATVKLFDGEGKPCLYILTDSAGNYTFSGLKSGNYSITCVKENMVIPVPENLFLQEEEVKTINFNVSYDISLALCSIAGHISKNDESNIAIGGAKITLLNSETRETIASTTSANDGEYVFYDIKEGSYIILATKIGYKTSPDTLVTAKNNTIINADIKLSINPMENLGTVSGKIKNKGNVLANAFVGLYKINENGKEELIATTKTNSEGLYMFGKVASGQYKVKAKQNKF